MLRYPLVVSARMQPKGKYVGGNMRKTSQGFQNKSSGESGKIILKLDGTKTRQCAPRNSAGVHILLKTASLLPVPHACGNGCIDKMCGCILHATPWGFIQTLHAISNKLIINLISSLDLKGAIAKAAQLRRLACLGSHLVGVCLQWT